jgi:ribosomal protein S18 acetylase RimI-like enzyme
MQAWPVRRTDLDAAADGDAVESLIDAYARDPRGGGQPLSPEARARLVPGLRAHPAARVWLAFDGEQPVGVCVAFIGFSTFQGRPLLNLHDVAVLPSHRGRGVGRALLEAAQAHARQLGCCKLTLEVQQDNDPALRLYARFGFDDLRFGASQPTRFLVKPLSD